MQTPTLSPTPSEREVYKFCAQYNLARLEFLRYSRLGHVIFYVLCFFPIPLLVWVLDRWLGGKVRLNFGFEYVTWLERTDTVLIVDQSGEIAFEPAAIQPLFFGYNTPPATHFTFKHADVRYLYDDREYRLLRAGDRFCAEPIEASLSSPRLGRPEEEIARLLETFGENCLAVPRPRVSDILIAEFSSVMGVFELVAIFLVYLDGTYRYLTFIIVLGVYSKAMTIKEAFAQHRALMSSLSQSSEVTVLRLTREGSPVRSSVPSEQLVPGDIVEMAIQSKVPADVVVIRGNCLIDDRSISGSAIPKVRYSVDRHLRAALSEVPEDSFCPAGTSCTYAGSDLTERALGLVLRTGFSTLKGQALRAQLVPKIVKFRFFEEAKMLLGILALFNLVGAGFYLVVQTYFMTEIEVSLRVGLIKVGQMFVTTVKPVLPFCLFMGLQASVERLRAKGIETSNKYKINEAGRVDTIFFDKTGTVTRGRSTFEGMYVCTRQSFSAAVSQVQAVSPSAIDEQVPVPKEKRQFRDLGRRLKAMRKDIEAEGQEQEQASIFRSQLSMFRQKTAIDLVTSSIVRLLNSGFSEKITSFEGLLSHRGNNLFYIYCISFCNSLIKVGKSMIGDTTDLEMFKLSPYELHYRIDPIERQLKKYYTLKPEFAKQGRLASRFDVLRSFNYIKGYKSEAFVVSDGEGQFFLVSKGAPETIAEFCEPGSVPANFDNVLYELGSKGPRLLGLACRALHPSEVGKSRKHLERDMVFCGLFAYANRLRTESPAVIKQLTDNLIRCVLITGDNLYTAISVAGRAGFLPKSKNLYLGDVVSDEGGEGLKIYLITFNFLGEEPSDVSLANRKTAYLNEHFILSIEELLKMDTENTILALTGKSYEFLLDRYYRKPNAHGAQLFTLLHRLCLVYARCDPQQKAAVLANHKRFNDSKYPVAYVGDGLNDIPAMEKADVALSLTPTDVTLTSQFSSARADLGKVLELVREGKANIENGYANFKFFIFLVCLQFVATYILYLVYIGFNSYQSIFIDVAILMVFNELLSSFGPCEALSRFKPKNSMFTVNMMFSTIGHVALAALITILGYVEFRKQPLYTAPHAIVPEADKENFSIVFDNYLFHDNHFLFVLICLLFVVNCLTANWRGNFKVRLSGKRKTLLAVSTIGAFLFYLGWASGAVAPDFVTEFFKRKFRVPATSQLLWLYAELVIFYALGALAVEKVNSIVFEYREAAKARVLEREFVQAETPQIGESVEPNLDFAEKDIALIG